MPCLEVCFIGSDQQRPVRFYFSHKAFLIGFHLDTKIPQTEMKMNINYIDDRLKTVKMRKKQT